VTKTVADYALVVGNPARQIGWMSEYGQRLVFDSNKEAVCSESKEVYTIQNNIVTKITH
jgi:UDP-2-acetamido-3-amino-2,3-dideoxy-glucuronate N-acetyltransferase